MPMVLSAPHTFRTTSKLLCIDKNVYSRLLWYVLSHSVARNQKFALYSSILCEIIL